MWLRRGAKFVGTAQGKKYLRWDILRALANLGPEPKAAVPTLTEDLKADDRHGRVGTAETLLAIGEGTDAAVAVLIELLENDDRENHLNAVNVLVKFGSSAGPAVPTLKRMYRSLVGRDENGYYCYGTE